MKAFKDLVFYGHPIALSSLDDYRDAKQASMTFDNGYGISVLLGNCFYSNGIDTYEVAVIKDGRICYTTPIANDVIGYITEEQVSEIMNKIQEI
ncbi:hypothetical protein [Dysgonomonas mossii]|uniref:Uncharacterized protein n=1 Tax=Dysgonomonas mossii DSM 22836 TaxID=742767 RepID=F8X2E1_9BACT|nr:hypothetical protein [Dysgonomonas mossii]EGK05789.1 hypothetical protein HMPREF9456_02400 [Dysgonomonas mossii DSM 22836]